MKKTSSIERRIRELTALIYKARLQAAAKAKMKKHKRKSLPVTRKIYVPRFVSPRTSPFRIHRRPSASPRRAPSPISSSTAFRKLHPGARGSRPSASPLFSETAVAIAPYVPGNQAPSASVRRSPKAKRSLFSIPENNNGFRTPPSSPKYTPAGGPPSTPRK